MTTREAFPNPDRPFRWPNEEDHWRSEFVVGDHVRYGELGHHVGVVVAWNNTWSHRYAGRLVHLVDDQTGRDASSWEINLGKAETGDVGSYFDQATRRWVPQSWGLISVPWADRKIDEPSWIAA